HGAVRGWLLGLRGPRRAGKAARRVAARAGCRESGDRRAGDRLLRGQLGPRGARGGLRGRRHRTGHPRRGCDAGRQRAGRGADADGRSALRLVGHRVHVPGAGAATAAPGDVLVFMDGDRQNDPNAIPEMLGKLAEGYDVVSGWRKDRRDAALTRRVPSRLANKLISAVSGVHLNDYGCTLKIYRREVIENVRLYGEMHRFIPAYAAWYGAKIAE